MHEEGHNYLEVTETGTQLAAKAITEAEYILYRRQFGNAALSLRCKQSFRAMLIHWETLNQQRELDSALLCMHMGQMQAYFAKWTEAEAKARTGVSNENQQEKWDEIVEQAEILRPLTYIGSPVDGRVPCLLLLHCHSKLVAAKLLYGQGRLLLQMLFAHFPQSNSTFSCFDFINQRRPLDPIHKKFLPFYYT